MTSTTPREATLDEKGLAAAFRAHTEGQTTFTRRMVIAIGDHFGLTPMQVIRHYERRGLLKPGSADWFKLNGGFTKEHFAEARCDRAVEERK